MRAKLIVVTQAVGSAVICLQLIFGMPRVHWHVTSSRQVPILANKRFTLQNHALYEVSWRELVLGENWSHASMGNA